jgi:hypothetical protein
MQINKFNCKFFFLLIFHNIHIPAFCTVLLKHYTWTCLKVKYYETVYNSYIPKLVLYFQDDNRKYFKRGELHAQEDEEYYTKYGRSHSKQENSSADSSDASASAKKDDSNDFKFLPRSEVIRKLRERCEPILFILKFFHAGFP